jgi:hypothetical protein
VWTRKDRWWVITNRTNLYSQADFVSMEVAFTYHLGLGIVLAHRNAPPEEDDEALKITGPWRRWTEAADALNDAVEAADFQAVGVRCRRVRILALLVRDPRSRLRESMYRRLSSTRCRVSCIQA